jgi:CRISPR-associated endoribonuclease Cas6
LHFRLYPLRFCFRARDAIRFPAGSSANILRGGFGMILRRLAGDSGAYARIFEPHADAAGPSGLQDWPRPFVFRAAHLDGRTIAASEPFHFDLHYFDLRNPAVIGLLADAFAELAREGLGPGRGRAELAAFSPPSEPLVLSLDPPPDPVRRVRVEFVTPTEIKGADRPEFGTLAARIRDRLSTLRELYDDGPLPIDFRAFGERAQQVRMTRCEIVEVSRTRRSSRTGQSHSIGGFIGEAEYEGDLAEFVPYLNAAAWTGIGRQTVWGKGEIRTVML